MATVSGVWGSDTDTVTITLASLASSTTAGRASTIVDNTSVPKPDAVLYGQVTTGTSPTVGTAIEIWVYASGDGTIIAGGASGSDAALTPVSTSCLRLAQTIIVSATSDVTYPIYAGSVGNLFGGPLPPKWGVWVRNGTGVALNATSGNHVIKYRTSTYASA